MKIKEKIAEEIEEYIQMFDKYDNELTESVEKKETEYQEKRKQFNEKWEEDIFPTDIPVRDQEAKELEDEANMLKEEKQKLDDDIKKSEQNLRSSISDWENKIDSRRKELVEYVNNRESYVEQKEKLEKELEEQIKGIELWEKNGINPNDVLYRRRKDVIIPNLEKQIEDINLILDESSIREEYKALGELKKQIENIKLHDRNHLIPELVEIFGITKDEPEPEVEQVETEQVETEEVEPEIVEPEIVEPEKVEPEPVNPRPVNPRPVNPEPAVKPIEPEIVEPEKVEPEQLQEEQVESELKPVRLIIGRNILIKGADGKTDKIGSIKEYFKYEKNSNWDEPEPSEMLRDELLINKKDPRAKKIEDLDSIIAFGLAKGLNEGLLSRQEVLKAIKAISSNNKELLDNTLPIEWDKNDLSKWTFPWNRKNRDEVVRHADENAEITNVTGKYEPNPIKRFLKRAKQALPQRKKQELITDGSEKSNEEGQTQEIEREEHKKEKLTEREGLKISKAYIDLVEEIDGISDKADAEKWVQSFKARKAEISEKEQKALYDIFDEKKQQLLKNKNNKIKESKEQEGQEQETI